MLKQTGYILDIKIGDVTIIKSYAKTFVKDERLTMQYPKYNREDFEVCYEEAFDAYVIRSKEVYLLGDGQVSGLPYNSEGVYTGLYAYSHHARQMLDKWYPKPETIAVRELTAGDQFTIDSPNYRIRIKLDQYNANSNDLTAFVYKDEPYLVYLMDSNKQVYQLNNKKSS